MKTAHAPDLAEAFRAMILEKSFPCVGAKSALGRGTLDLLSARSITSAWDDLAIHDALMRFAWAYREDPGLFRSFAVLFEGPDDLDEAGFEAAMWARLQSLADKDEWRGQAADPRVSSDPADPHFGMSFGGEAFFIVGLHPQASRPARRFERPALVFNLHDQFETLREQNRYEQLRASIIERDVALAGSPNPMLSRHGETSEARQYSGRAVGADWRCPFSRRSGGDSGLEILS
ncbi:guanitoxin biosynthesis heme-dependent pre-guanitoxin N-hydroxylase GntA [Sphingomonas spermidinifaciens]